MTQNLRILLIAATITFATQFVYAEGGGGLFLEPGIIYEFNSKSSLSLPSPLSNTSGSVEGVGASVKAGFHASQIIFGGVDLRYSQPKFKDSSNTLETTARSLNYGVLLGAQTGLYGIRAWGEYVFGGSLDPELDNNIDYKFEEAMGWRLGAGIRLGLVSLNIEYQDLEYDKTQAIVAGVPINSDSSELTNKALVASVSFPLDL